MWRRCNEEKSWSTVKGEGYNGGLFVLGDKPEQLPETAFISLTRGERLNFLQLFVNQILTLMVMSQMKKTPGLIYAEIKGELIKGKGYGQTMTVWEGKSYAEIST